MSLYWNEQLLMYLREKTLQDRQQALVLEFHGRLLMVVFVCWHQRRKRKLLINQYNHRLDVYALHVIIQMHSDYPDAFPQLISLARASSDQLAYTLCCY